MFEDLKLPSGLLPEDGRFGSGPTRIPLSFIEKLKNSGTDILGNSHRNKNILNLVKNCQEKMKSYFGLPEDWEIILGNGGASFIWEMLAFSAVKNKSAHFTCGEFSAKWHSLTDRAPWLKTENNTAAYGSLPDLVYEGDADLICLTHNETSTGVMIPSCPKLKRENNLVAVDATSIAGVTNWNWEQTDMYYFSLQKAFGSEGGLYFALVSPHFSERVKEINATDRYIPTMLNFQEVIENSRKNQTVNTPALSTLFFLECALDEFMKKGLVGIEKESRQKADFLYGFAEKSGFMKPYVKNPEQRSISVATLDLADQVSADDLVKAFRKNGIVDINSYRKLGKNQIRIGIFPLVPLADVEKLVNCLDYAAKTVL